MIGDWARSTGYDILEYIRIMRGLQPNIDPLLEDAPILSICCSEIKGKNQPYSEIFAPDEAGVFNDTI